jgi:hypothetical protein
MKTFQERREENLCNQVIAQEFGLKGGYFNNPEYTHTHTHTHTHTNTHHTHTHKHHPHTPHTHTHAHRNVTGDRNWPQ